MKVHVQGQGSTTLTKRDFLASGGQGDVYARGDVAYKVYTDPARMIPVAKIGELAMISDPNVIRPQSVLLDDAGRPIGYTMRFVKDTLVLCATFTRAFRQRSGLTPDKSLGLVRHLRTIVTHVHAARSLIVDLNELNFLVDAGLSEVYAIDVDSYQTPGYRASALMESVRDRHSTLNHFTELTDWFAWAVVSWQMFIGIHPYKGRHPKLGDDMDARMTANVSVLNPEVTYPKGVVLPFDVVPKSLLSWYTAVFERGERSIPPDDRTTVIAGLTTKTAVAVGVSFEIRELFTMPWEILGYYDSPVHSVVVCTDGFYLGNRKALDHQPNAVVGYTPKQERPIAAWVAGGKLSLYDLVGKRPVFIDLDATGVTISNGRIYVLSHGNLIEMKLLELGTSIIAAAKIVGTALELATFVGDGALIQNLLGSYFTSIFPAEDQHHQVRLKELDGSKILEVRYRRRVLMVVAGKGGQYNRHVFRFDAGFGAYDHSVVSDITPTGLNFVVHQNGTCIAVDEEARVVVSSNRMGSAGERVIVDPAVSVAMRLGIRGAQTVFWEEDTLSSITMRGKP